MTIPEQAGKIATSVVDALKQSPAMLVLAGLLVALFFVTEHNNDRRQERELLLLKTCLASVKDDGRR